MTGASTPSSVDLSKLDALKDELYAACVASGTSDRLFTQKDLLSLDVIPEDNTLLLVRVVQGLTDDKLFAPVSDPRKGLAWRYRTREDAEKYQRLPSAEAVLVYTLVDEAGSEGIWTRQILRRLGMHDATLKHALKQLESKGFISEMKSVEHPNKKMYIKANLRPSERATGGPWYNDSVLDEPFIAELERVVFDIVKAKSTYRPHVSGSAAAGGGAAQRMPKKGVVRGGAAAEAGGPRRPGGRKRTAAEAAADETPRTNGAGTAATAPPQRAAPPRKNRLLPLPAGYVGYPTVVQIAQQIEKAGVAKNQTLEADDIQVLVDVLVYDGLIEPVRHGYEPRRPGYRAVGVAQLESAPSSDNTQIEVVRMGPPARENGLTEAPCGRCPVFELCDEGGPVSPRTCIYYNKWLGLEDDAGKDEKAPFP